MKIRCTVLTLMLLLLPSHHALAGGTPANALDALYQAGIENDERAFFALLSADAVVIGIDGSDRLQGRSLRSFLSDRFARRAGWHYLSRDRKYKISEDGSVAWFEESLEHNALGRGWGSGVLIKSSEGWKLAQYNLNVSTSDNTSIPVAPVSQEISTPAKNVSTDTPSETAATETVTPAPKKKKSCRRIRHKTNKVSRC